VIGAFLRDESGQAFYETVAFMPLMLLALLSIIFFARLGVLSERAESAVRYGDMVSFRNGEAYSTAAISYLLNQAVYGNTSGQLAALCLTAAPTASASAAASASPSPAPSATGINADILAALYQVQVVHSASPSGAPSPAVTPQRFFQADSITQPNCNPGTINLAGQSGAGASGTYTQLGTSGSTGTTLPMDIDNFSITAKVNLNSYLVNAIGSKCTQASGVACSSTTANMAFLNVAAPTTLITCVPGISVVLTIMNPLAKPQSCT
jgi:hypothetical protein